MRRFNCGEAEWLEEHGVDPRDATVFAYGVSLSDIADVLHEDLAYCEECGREDKLTVEHFGPLVRSVVCTYCTT